ncbi:MAG: glycosyltransferase family A protein [Caldilineaceae bacterium]
MANNDHNSVSVIVPVYNNAAYLTAALTSVYEQSYQPQEIIVIDDGSVDDAKDVVVDLAKLWETQSVPQIRYLYQSNRGPAAARNRGVALAQGTLLAFLDADDWWHPHKLQRQVEWLAQRPTLGFVLSHMHVQLESSTRWPVSLNQSHYQNNPPCILPSALLVRCDTFHRVGGFDEHYRYSDDADWFLRAKDAAIPFAIVEEPLVYKRIHDSNLSHSPGMAQETLRAFHASIQRQRQSQRDVRVSKP